MRLREYVDGKGRGEIARLARECSMSYATVFRVYHGHPLKLYATARKLSDCTGGAVSVAELCEPNTEPVAITPAGKARKTRGAA